MHFYSSCLKYCVLFLKPEKPLSFIQPPTILCHYVYFGLSLVSEFSHIRITTRVYLNFLFLLFPRLLTLYFSLSPCDIIWVISTDLSSSSIILPSAEFSLYQWLYFLFLEFVFCLFLKPVWSSFIMFLLYRCHFLFYTFLLFLSY